MSLIEAIKEGIRNFFRLLDPYKASDFFKNMEIKPANYTLKYLAVAGLFLFAGYYLNLVYKMGFESESTCSPSSSAESAFITYISLIVIPLIAGSIISLFGKSLVGKDLETNEVVLIIGYPLSFIMVSGLFKVHVLTIILHYLGIGYGLYLLYTAINARFGFDKALIVFVFFVMVSSLMLMITFWFGINFVNLLVDALVWLGIPSSDLPITRISPWCY